MKKKIYILSRSFMWALFIALLLTLALVPNLFPLPTFYTDKMLHITLCTLFLIWANFKFSSPKIILSLGFALAIMGIGVELVQGMIPGRSFSPDDIAANITGIFCGMVIGYLLRSGYYAGLD